MPGVRVVPGTVLIRLRVVVVVTVTRGNLLGLLDVDMEIGEQVLAEIVPRHLAAGHELVWDLPGVPNDQRHLAPGRNPERFGSKRVLVECDVDPQRLGLLTGNQDRRRARTTRTHQHHEQHECAGRHAERPSRVRFPHG